MENSSPVVEVRVDALKAKSAGLTPSQIATAVSNCIDGVKATTIQVNGEDIDVKVQYAEDEYKSIDQVRGHCSLPPERRFCWLCLMWHDVNS